MTAHDATTSPATAGELVTQALAAEQERLTGLPHIVPGDDYFDDFYGGKLVLAYCHHSGEKVEKTKRPGGTKPECWCGLPAKPQLVTDDDHWVEHSKPLPEHEQVERAVELVAALLGFDHWSNADTYARAATRDESSRRLGFDGKVARGVAYLAEQLVRRDATQGAQAALAELLAFAREREEHPLFTEAGLYDLIGKGDARSVLSRLNTLTTAMGGVTS